MTIRSDMRPTVSGSVKRSLAMALLGCGATIAKACGLDAATHGLYTRSATILSYNREWLR